MLPSKLRITGLIGVGNYAMSTLLPNINGSKNGYVSSLLGRGAKSTHSQKRFNINQVTTDKNDFYNTIDAVFVATPTMNTWHYIKGSSE